MTETRESRLGRDTRGAARPAPLRFRVLGPIEVFRDRGPLALGGPKQRAVLALLLIHGNEVVTADALSDELWGDEPPESWANVIQTYVSLLRRELGTQRILTRGGGYVLDVSPDELDAGLFERLVRDARASLPVEPGIALGSLEDALGLWRGPALADVADHPRISREADRLHDARQNARELRVEAMLATGQDARALTELDSVIAEDPLRENLWALRMRTLYRQGRQAEALAAYGDLRILLRDELGIDPSPELSRLHQRILQQDPTLEARGEPLRGYRLLERLAGRGEEATYRAIQPTVSRDVTVRIVGGPIASSTSFVREFERRLASVAALEHPHIAPIHDYWREDGRACIVSRYLRGGTLETIEARDGAIPPEQGRLIIEQIGAALAYVHQQGVAHGDLSSAAVAFDGEGHAYLTDFQVAPTPDAVAAADVLGLLTLARRLVLADASLQAVLQRLGDDGTDVSADDVVTAVRGRTADGVARAADVGARSPYKGLRPFGEPDARDFHGRDAAVLRLLDRLRESETGARFLAIVGPSGAGKSSLVRAGLLPALRDGGLLPADQTFVTELFPGAHPREELEAALARVALRADAQPERQLRRGDRALLEAVDRLLPSKAELVLLVDQLEEVFTLTTEAQERDGFLEMLRVAAVDPASRVRIIVTLRADFYDRPLLHRRFGELMAARTEAIAPMAVDELEAAIRRPAEGVGARLESALVSALITDVAHQPGALPLLEYALTELFEQRRGGVLTVDAYRAIGGLGGALSSRADRILDGFDPARQAATRQLFLRLVTLGEGREDTRRRVLRRDLSALAEDPAVVDDVLQAFGRHRLLTFDRDPASREPTVEIAHEALLAAWSRLRSWIGEARDDLRFEAGLVRGADEWRASGHDPSFLLRGVRLDQAEAWAAGTSLAIGHGSRAYLKASLERRDAERESERQRQRREAMLERRSRSRLRALVAVLAVAAVVAGILSVVAASEAQRAGREARVARARELAAASSASRELDVDRAIGLAIEAVEATRPADGFALREAEEALHQAVMSSRAVASLPGVAGPVAWIADGKVAVGSAAEPGHIDVIDPRSWQVERSLRGHASAITGLAADEDGDLLASGASDGTLRLWDLVSDTASIVHEGTGVVSGIALATDGSRVAATWGDEEVVRVFETSDGALLGSYRIVEGGDLALSPDGSIVGFVTHDGHDYVGRLRRVGDPGGSPHDLVVDGGILVISWSPDGRHVATGGFLGADLWDGHTFEHLGHVTTSDPTNRLAWDRDSRLLATAGDESPIVDVWAIDAGSATRVGRFRALETALGVGTVAFEPGGGRLIAGGDGAKVWSLDPGSAREILTIPTIDDFGDAAFAMGDRAIVAADEDGDLHTFDLASGRASAPIGFPVGQHSFDVSPDGSALAMPLFDRGLAAWDLESGRRLFHRPDIGNVDEVDWSPDGEHLVASLHSPRARSVVLDRQGNEVASFDGSGVSPDYAWFSPEGRLVAVIGFPDEGGGATLWDWRRDTVESRYPLPPAQMVAFSPDGSRLVTGFGSVGIVDADSGESSLVLEGQPLNGNDVTYSPDGSRVAVAGADGRVHLFDALSGVLTLTLDAGDGLPVGHIGFDSDGSMLAAQSPGSVRIYALGVDELVDIARARVTRPLSVEECATFLHLDACPAPDQARS